MKKTIALVATLLVTLCGNWVFAQNQNYLPAKVQMVSQEKFIEAYKNQTGITDEDVSVNAYKIWVNAWFGRVSSQNGVLSITFVSWDWNDGHFYNGKSWAQGNRNTNSLPKTELLDALNDLQQRAESIIGSSLPPLNGEYPNKYVERILKYLSVVNASTDSRSQEKLF